MTRPAQGAANVHRMMANGGPTANGLAHLEEWLGGGRWGAIQFRRALGNRHGQDHP